MTPNSSRYSSKAVAYVRMSSDRQETSPAQQRQQIERLAAARDIKILRWYADLGISGDDIKRRTGFRRMIADAHTRRDFSLILCWSQDRFGRFDSIEAGEWVAPLRRAGISLITVAEGDIDWTDSAGRLLYSIQQEGKNTFLLDLARNSARGRCQAAKKIGFVGGILPYGYDRIVADAEGKHRRRITRSERFRCPDGWTDRLVLSNNNVATKTVRFIFRSYARGMSVEQITYRLNQQRIPSPNGKRWWTCGIRSLLTNPVYTGDQVWNRRHMGKYFAIVNGEIISESQRVELRGPRSQYWCPNPEEDWIVVRDAHPALVTRKMFNQAQSRMNQRRGRAAGRPGLPLTGLVICGHCGAHMSHLNRRRVVGGSECVYLIMLCPTANKQGPQYCKSRVVSESQIRCIVVDLLRRTVIGNQFEDTLRRRIQLDSLSVGNPVAERERLVRQEARLSKQIEKGTQNLLLAEFSDLRSASLALHAWQEQRDTIASRLTALESATPRKINADVAETMDEIRRLRFGLSSSDRALLHHTLQQLVKRITLWFEPSPTKPGCCQLASGTIDVQIPYRNDTVTEETITFTAAEMEKSFPRWQFWPCRTKPKTRRPTNREFVRLETRIAIKANLNQIPASLI